MATPLDHARLSRRRTLGGAAVAGLGVPLLAACGDGSTGTATDPAPTSEAPSSPATSPTASKTPVEPLTTTADVPTGGGQVLADAKLVVTQPAAGEFRCFTAVCTHQGCLVSNVDGGTINCTCHGSRYSITDGSVTNGPATSPLDEVAVSVRGGSVVRS